MSRREKVIHILNSLLAEALNGLEEDPRMDEPVAVGLSVVWRTSPHSVDGLPVTIVTGSTAIHETCPVSHQTAIYDLAHALDDLMEGEPS